MRLDIHFAPLLIKGVELRVLHTNGDESFACHVVDGRLRGLCVPSHCCPWEVQEERRVCFESFSHTVVERVLILREQLCGIRLCYIVLPRECEHVSRLHKHEKGRSLVVNNAK